VIDPSFDASKDLDFNKIQAAASAEIDALEEDSTSASLDPQYPVTPPAAQPKPMAGTGDRDTAASQRPMNPPRASFALDESRLPVSTAVVQFGVGDLQWDTSDATGRFSTR